uniref:Uncharacterized protein n=1 Tax=Anguilla anguilla TaxID=7936 RepID=A0A0E9WRU6_ANGAN
MQSRGGMAFQKGAWSCEELVPMGEVASAPFPWPLVAILCLRLSTLSSKDLNDGEFLMSPSFLLMAVPTLDRAAEVI